MDIHVKLPGEEEMSVPAGATAMEVISKAGAAPGGKVVAAKVNGQLRDLSTRLDADCAVEAVSVDSEEGLDVLRHTTSHVMAQAVGHLFPKAKYAIGPAVSDGFYYDFDLPRALTDEDLKAIESEMRKIVRQDIPVVRREMSREEALRDAQRDDQTYKVELIEDLPDGEPISAYEQGDFSDLCRGPHLPSTGGVRAFKLLSVAGAYWRGDSRRQQLQRIYGTAFADKAALKEHLQRLEEAQKRDHRRLGKDLDLFSTDAEIGQGLILWHPKGATIRRVIESFLTDELVKRGYQIVYTPHIASERVYVRSGHIPKYEEMMYAPLQIDQENYRLKPMNCPGHIKIYQTRRHSYRELPVRLAELGTVYRYELSGALQGMLRVRGFTQDDAHVFCTPDQITDEILGILDFVDYMMRAFGYTYKAYLSTRPEVYLQEATDEEWERATEGLRQALERRGMEYEVDEGAGVFYAPKIDIKLFDALGREWQGPTIQVDLNLPKRFEVEYTGPDGQEHETTIIHRTILGSMERFVGGLIEHYAGRFPVWLAPVQVRVLPITDAHVPYGQELAEQMLQAGFRAECDSRNEKTGYKVREATLQKIPYSLIVGNKEVSSRSVAVRSLRRGDEGAIPFEEFVKRLRAEVDSKLAL